MLNTILDQNINVYVSVMTELELFSFPNLTSSESEQIDFVLTTTIIMPLDSRLARIAASIRKQYKLKASDSVIAATSLLMGSTLITRNVRDFRKIEKLSLLEI